MTFQVADRVRETLTGVTDFTGQKGATATISLPGTAATGYDPFSRRFSNSDANIPVVIVHRTADEWQACMCTYTSSNLLTVNTIVATSEAADAAPSFSAGDKDIYVAAISRNLVPRMASGEILVGNSNNLPASVAMSGDVTISNTGATTIGNLKIVTGMIADDQVTYGKMQPTNDGSRFLGRSNAAAGDIGEISPDAAITLLNLASTSTVNFARLAGVQASDATLTALAAYNTNGILTQTAADTFAGRSIAAGTGITVTNGDGISGNPTVALTSNTISGVALGSNLNTLTLGTGLGGTSYNGTGAVTASVTYGTSASTACVGNDARLSDARTPTSHVHGNISNAGAIGTTANLPIITTTSGVLTTGSFGTSANTFCQGNDARLSDTRIFTANNTYAFAAGTSGSPSITANGDTNTGAWFPAADTIAFSTAGTEKVRLHSSGKMSIGTSSEAANFQVSATAANNDGHIQVNVATDPSVMLVVTGAQAWSQWVDSSDSNKFKIGPSNAGVQSATEYLHITTAGRITVHAPEGLGYGTGAGGAVTQATSKATGVTLNTACGQITLNSATLNAGASETFTLTNSKIELTDTVIVNTADALGDDYTAIAHHIAAGSCKVRVTNISGGNLSEAVKINFAVIKAVT